MLEILVPANEGPNVASQIAVEEFEFLRTLHSTLRVLRLESTGRKSVESPKIQPRRLLPLYRAHV